MSSSEKSYSIQRTITREAVWLILLWQIVAMILVYWQLCRFCEDFESLRHTNFAMDLQDEIARRGGSRAAFQHVAESAISLNPGIRLLFVDRHGSILESLPKTEGGAIPFAEIAKSLEPALPDNRIRLQSRAVIGYDALFSSAPGMIAGSSGVLLIVLPQFGFSLREPILIALLVLIAGSICAALLVRTLVRSQLRGVLAVSNAARGYLQGGELTRVPVLPPGEVNDLGQQFNRLADSSKTLQERIEATEAERRTLLAGLVHDLSAPVTSLVGFVALAKESLARAAAEEVRDHLRRVLRATDRLTPLIQNLGKLGELELERLQPRFAPVDIQRLLEQTIETLHGAARRKGVLIEYRPRTAATVIEGDEELLRRVFENLLSNAVRFTLSGGRVTLFVKQEGADVAVTCADTGVGIAEADKTAIFGEYIQAMPKGEGVGLGLALVKRFVDVHQGAITVESRLGEGSTFRVTLPIAPTPTKPPILTRAKQRRVDVPRVALHVVIGGLAGMLPLALGEPPRGSYAFLGFGLGLVPILLLRLCRGRVELLAALGTFVTAVTLSLFALRRAELVCLGLGAALVISLPLSFSFVRSFALSIATRIGCALNATGILALIFVAAGMWFSVEQQRTSRVREASPQLLQSSVEVIQALYRESGDLERALFTFQSLAPLLAAVLPDREGVVWAESVREEGFGLIKTIQPPGTGVLEREVELYSKDLHTLGRERAVVGTIDLDGTHDLFLLLDTRLSVELCRHLFESTTLFVFLSGCLISNCMGITLAFRIQRLIRPRLAYAFELLAQQPSLAPRPAAGENHCDEIDEILGALSALTATIRSRESTLADLQRARCDLIARVYRSLEEPLEELRFQLAHSINLEADLEVLAPRLDRIGQIVDAEQTLLRELNEYARTVAHPLSAMGELYRVDELLQDIVLKLQRAGRRIQFYPSESAPFVELQLTLVNKVLQFAIEARTVRLGPLDELRCEVHHRGTEVVIVLLGREVGTAGERSSALFSEIRRAIVAGYLEHLGGRISQCTEGEEVRTEIVLPAA